MPVHNCKKKIRSTVLILLAIPLAMCFLVSCFPSGSPAEKRAKRAAGSEGDIVVGIVDSSGTGSLFLDGVNMAIDEINEEGGILGRKISALYYDDEGSPETGQDIARKIAGNKNIVAVIGHRFSDIAIIASVTYEENGILFISPGATDQDLIRESSKYTFRNIPSDFEFGKQTAEFAERQKYQNIAIIYDSESSGKRIAELFRSHADKLGLRIVAEKAYAGWEGNFRLMIADIMRESKFDAIFLGGVLPSAADMIKQIRDMGITTPIIGNDLIDSPVLLNIAGKAAHGTIVPTVFDPKRSRSLTLDFVKRFQARMGLDPDTWAAQGYDAVRVLAHAMEENGSTIPIEIGTTLRFLTDWRGVTGSYSFDRNGNIQDKTIMFKKVDQGEWAFLERELRKEFDPFEVLADITLRVPIDGAIKTIDPGLSIDTAAIEVVEQLFLGLTDFNPETYEPVAELAVRWDSEDAQTYRFQMRDDAKWTGGQPVTADDVVWAVRRNISPETKSPYAYFIYIVKNAEKINKGEEKDLTKLGVRALGPYTVEFELEYPAAYFPSMAGLGGFRPLPRKVVESYKEKWTRPEVIQTNGSYKLEAWEKGMALILRRNPNYFAAESVAIPEVRYYIIPESSVGLAMYKSNQLDIMGGLYLRIPLDEVPTIVNHPDLSKEYRRTPLFCNYAYAFNTLVEPVNNPLVRKAISAAIDRKMIIRLITHGDQNIATTYTPPPIFGSVEIDGGVGIGFDPVLAKELLAEAGYPNGEGCPEIVLLYNFSENHKKMAEAIQTLVKHHLNITITPVALEWSEYLAARVENFPGAILIFRYCADYPDANNWLNELFHPAKSVNVIGWENQEFAQLMEMAQIDTDPDNRRAIYRRAEKILCEEECVVLPIYFETAQYLVKPRIKGWYSMALGGQHIRNWQFEEQ